MIVIFKWRHLHVKSQDPRGHGELCPPRSVHPRVQADARTQIGTAKFLIVFPRHRDKWGDEHKPQHPRPFHLQSLITSSLVQSGNVCKLTTMQTAHKHPTVNTKIKLSWQRESKLLLAVTDYQPSSSTCPGLQSHTWPRWMGGVCIMGFFFFLFGSMITRWHSVNIIYI